MTLADATAFPYGLRVLVVDDDPTWLNILEKMLRKCSYEVTTCSLASVALQILRERRNKFDIVISDVNMIDMDGFKLLEHIGLEMDLPVIMMSIDGEISRVRKGVQHGACDYLLKTVRMKELRNIWQHVYRKKMHEVKEIEGYDSCDDLQIFRNGCEGLEERGLFMRADSDTMRKRKDVDNADQDSSDGTTVKKARVVWSVDLHQKFVNAVNQIGFDKIGPKKILDLMNVPGLTRENVASHLLKYRLYLSRLQKQNEERIMGATKVTCASQQSLLSAVDEILHLKEIHAFPMASPAHRHMDTALGVAMSRLMDEFLLLRVWDASQLEGRHGLRVAVERLSVSVAPGGSGVWLDFPTSGSISTGELSVSTTDELHASGMSISSWPDLSHRVPGSTGSRNGDEEQGIHEIHAEDLHLIHPASLPLLHEIALRVIRAGYSKEFLQTFAMAPCHVLDRFLSIVQLDRPSFATNRVNFEDAEWWATEDMVKRWILATKLIGKAIVVMRMQLMAQECGAFDRFKDAYFMAIAKQRILVLLKFADGFTSTRSPEKLIYVLELYEALSSSAPALLPLFTGQHAELISRQVPDVLAKLARALRAAIGGLITKIRTDCSQEASATIGVGVHSLARHAMTCVDLLAPHRATLDLILANGGGEDERGAPAGGADGVTSFGSLASELIAGLERNLDEKSALACAVGSPSSRHLFLANNTGFVLSRAGDAGVASLLGDDEWAARRRSLLEQHAASYIQATWGPVVACLETAVAGGRGKPAKALAKFNAAFEKTHGGQVCREVWDPALRAAMRMAVKEMVVPAYSAFLHKHPRLGKSVRYTADDLAESLSELFEGDAADDGKS